jgi:membrane fusion protein, multidrug efflux system
VNQLSNGPLAGNEDGKTGRGLPFKKRPGAGIAKWLAVVIAIAVVGLAWLFYSESGGRTAPHAPRQALPQVVVSKPLEQELDTQLGFLGQFSAVDQVELRARSEAR